MSQPYVGEIILVGFNFAPQGWAFCDGSLMAISQNETLFQLIGTTYGGDGQSTFALPDLRGRAPVHMGQGSGLSSYQLGEMGGTETTTLTTSQVPSHTHVIDRSGLTAVARCRSGAGNLMTPVNDLPATVPYAFTDDPVVANVTGVKAAHITELRSRVDGFRQSVGLGGYDYADNPLTVDFTLIKAQHLLDLRAALTEACQHAGVSSPSFDPSLAPGETVKASYINELRTALSTATGGGAPRYGAGVPDASMAAGSVVIGGTASATAAGGSQPHGNLQPYLTMNYCISLFGVFPSQY